VSDDDTSSGKFIPLSVLIELVLSQDKVTFLDKHPESVLLIDNPGEEAETASGFQTIDVGKQSSVDSDKRKKLIEKLSSSGSHVFVLKREKGKFASMLTVGRAANNAMRIDVGSVSKFHAYFTHVAREKAWFLADAHSSNGTFTDGRELPPSHGKQKLKSGCILRFGPDVTAQYFEAEDLWDLLNSTGFESGVDLAKGIPADGPSPE
jgi:hypothetical protein